MPPAVLPFLLKHLHVSDCGTLLQPCCRCRVTFDVSVPFLFQAPLSHAIHFQTVPPVPSWLCRIGSCPVGRTQAMSPPLHHPPCTLDHVVAARLPPGSLEPASLTLLDISVLQRAAAASLPPLGLCHSHGLIIQSSLNRRNCLCYFPVTLNV